jgi:glycine/D-amino acid oxidase-like deaminating enzyme
MPELPEVETVCRGIAPHLAHGAVFSPLEGHLDTGRLVARFRSLLHTAGIPLLHGLSASSIRAHHDRPTLTLTPNANSNSNANPNTNIYPCTYVFCSTKFSQRM